MGPKKCEVCNDANSKYKCPSCLTPYCSLVCYKKHKEIPCETTTTTSVAVEEEASNPLLLATTTTDVPVLQRPLVVHNPGDVLQQLQLESIASSTEIRQALMNDETLQKIIQQIDSSSETATAEIQLTNAMEEVEAFYKFTDKIRSIITPQ
ncbi:uncharacterized zinc-finger protein C4F10.19c [Impatiens glandulifera]|uniref:uncharacterized zinc-finger protein C4F10.19c n=1 Tax=Impatiens glandulifera TaxID=253017 RepID=UPI001FB16954|nr:uncharacterized zinc-finger protein C4F10.19c [Impatiens glandulifera]